MDKFEPKYEMSVVLSDFQLHNLVTAQIVKKNIFSNVWKRGKEYIMLCVNNYQY